MRKAALKTTIIVLATFLCIFSLSASVFGQDASAGSISGSTSSDTRDDRGPKPPSTPKKRAKFFRKQLDKYKGSSRKSGLQLTVSMQTLTIAPEVATAAKSASSLEIAVLETDYDRELAAFAKEDRLLLLDDYMRARFIENILNEKHPNVNAHFLLEGKLLKGNSFEKTLINLNVPQAEAKDAVIKADNVVKSLK